ncbi:MAG: peptidylprolyl isomerase [Myxococcota bacterium]|nr:peptidylprolyl isomerase [Myxococcota bacterium]
MRWAPTRASETSRTRSHPMEQVRASHILLMYAGSARSTATRTKAEALAGIEGLKAELDGGADFAGLAVTNSDCPSARSGGDLGPFGRGQMVPEFEEAAFNMEIGDVSDVIETDFGYHLVTRTG